MARVKIKLADLPGVVMPSTATPGAAGYDLCAAEGLIIKAGCFGKVATGIRIEMPQDLEAQIRPRSGLAAKYGVTVLNSPGTIDSDYRGEICVILINHGQQDFEIEPGMRIAQMVFAKVTHVDFAETGDLDSSARGEGGFGSTGTSQEVKTN